MLSMHLPPQPTSQTPSLPQFYSVRAQPPVFPQSRPPAKQAWSLSMHQGVPYGPPIQGYGVMPRLIDPREVLAYENLKLNRMGQGFQVYY